MPTINTPPLQQPLPVSRVASGDSGASWPKAWGNWFQQVWQALAYGWQWQSTTVSADYTVSKTDTVILLNADATVYLPVIRDGGPKRITVKVINAGAGTRTVDGNSANIDGASSVTTTTQYMAWDFINDGSNWFVV